MSESPWPFYVSYSWETEGQQPLVDKLEEDAKAFSKLNMVRDTDQCQPGDSIKVFLDEVGQAPRLVLVLSDPYFRSKYTLQEFAIALVHGGINTRVRVVLVGDFRLDRLLASQGELQNAIDAQGIDLNLGDHQEALELLADSLVNISSASEQSKNKAIKNRFSPLQFGC